jgi:hypothetical protein
MFPRPKLNRHVPSLLVSFATCSFSILSACIMRMTHWFGNLIQKAFPSESLFVGREQKGCVTETTYISALEYKSRVLPSENSRELGSES